jgi:RNA polymerase sigma factor (sigma-70 family)
VNHAVDYKQLFEDNLALVDQVVHFVARRHLLSAADADEFASVVHLRLIEHDYAVLRKFQHRSNLHTYLATVVERMYLDDCIARWGKWRPSALALRRGPVGVQLERLIGRDGLTPNEAIEILLTNERVAASRRELETIAAELPQRVSRKPVGEEELSVALATGPPVDAGLVTGEQASRAEQVQQALEHALAGLYEEDRLVLKLRFVDGLPVASIARALGIESKGLYRRLEHIMREMRAALMLEGVGASDIDELVGHPEVVVDAVFGRPAPETPDRRPSKRLKDG